MHALLFLFILLGVNLGARAATQTGVERINFFPATRNFATFTYRYELYSIEAPPSALQSREVQNLTNHFALSYARKVHEKAFLGVTGYYEQASENGVRYGLPVRERFTSRGMRDPELFTRVRLRSETEERGLIDLTARFAYRFGPREIGVDGANRLNGQHRMMLGLHHGKREDEWEFRTSLALEYFDEGEETNGFNERVYDLGSHRDVYFRFQVQYELREDLFVNGSVGFKYLGTQSINDRQGTNRHIQAGTGSIFGLGLKRTFGEAWALELNYTYSKNDYFVKGAGTNLEGVEVAQVFGLFIATAF
jgi:hypothetical protein